ncbi:hypothetical protein H2203_000685 [Taxawa tesnikishii (nom. ined.)]|nr:hypothetical protein H2203_000685 [Dothideales sp. JES 119]
MPTAVVTGCNSGIGNSFAQVLINEVIHPYRSKPQTVHQHLQQGYTVYATDYVVGEPLKALKCNHAELNVRSPESVAAFGKSLTDSDTTIDLILNVAGVMSPAGTDDLSTVSFDVLTKTFASLLLRSQNPRIAIVSSRVGSIGDNSTGGSYAYRASKAAVNSVGKSLAMDLKDRGVVVSLLHPGFVKTNLDVRTHEMKEAVMPDEAAEKLWKVFSAKGMQDTGKFWHREGYELPW